MTLLSALLPAQATVAAPTSRPDLSATTQSHRLIAKFLASQGYTETLAAFTREATAFYSDLDLFQDNASGGLDLREVVENYLATRLAEMTVPPAPLEEELDQLELKTPLPEKVTRTIRETTNVLSVKGGALSKRSWDSAEGRFTSSFTPCVFTTAVDRTIKILDAKSYDLLDTYDFPSPVLSLALSPQHHSRFLVAGMMEGSLYLMDLVSHIVLQKLKDHTKYIVKTAWSDDGRWVATIGYDKAVIIYEVVESAIVEENALLDGEEPDELAATPRVELVKRHTHTTKTNPEAAVFLPGSSHLVFSARDDHLLHYLRLPAASKSDEDFSLSSINLNENNDAWVSFSILHITLHPRLPILSLQTSTENSRILLLPFHSSKRLATIWTTAEQGEYSTPRHSWLPDGSAVVVNSEDGILRVVDVKGNVRLRVPAHGAAAPLEEEGPVEGRSERARLRRETERGSSVVRDVEVLEEGGKVVFVSCGFDKTVRVVGMDDSST